MYGMGNGQVKVLLINVQHVVIVNPKAQKSMLKDIGTTVRTAGQKWMEVKAMAEYIEREEIFRLLHKFYYKNPPYERSYQEGYNRGLDCASHEIGKLTAADVAPVRHGKWIENYGAPNVKRCSVCKTERWAKDSWWRYCPNCGAKMDGKKGE